MSKKNKIKNDQKFKLDDLEGKSGVYIISPEYDEKDLFLVKIGTAMAKKKHTSTKKTDGLRSRLESYLLCYPRGYYLYAYFQTNYNKAFEIERYIQQYLTCKNRKSMFPHTRSEEWYWMTLEDLHKIYKIFIFVLGGKIRKSMFFDPTIRISNNTRIKRQRIKPISISEKLEIDQSSKTLTLTPPKTVSKSTKSKQRVKNRSMLSHLKPKSLKF